jgi:hypothetical protein
MIKKLKVKAAPSLQEVKFGEKKGKVQVIEPDEKAMLVVFNETTNTMKVFWQEKEIGAASFATDLDGDLAFGYLVQQCKEKIEQWGRTAWIGKTN